MRDEEKMEQMGRDEIKHIFWYTFTVSKQEEYADEGRR
jgi:hypothetical protein